MTTPNTIWNNRCRCCDTAMLGSDHCPLCYCEEYNERTDCWYRLDVNQDSRETEYMLVANGTAAGSFGSDL